MNKGNLVFENEDFAVYVQPLKANYSIEKETDQYILIRDLGPWDKYATVTNAAEAVVKDLAGRLAGRRLFYYDSEGEPSEMLHKAGQFAGFRFGMFVDPV